MSNSFKVKNKIPKITDIRETIDSIHTKIENDFIDDINKIPTLKKRISTLNQQIQKLNKKKHTEGIELLYYSNKKISICKNEIDILTKKINNCKDYKDLLNYYTTVFPLLLMYYNTSVDEHVPEPNNEFNVLSILNTNVKKSHNFDNIISYKNNSKQNLYKQYMNLLEGRYTSENKNRDICELCNGETVITNYTIVCKDCATVIDHVTIVTDNLSYKEMQDIEIYKKFCYEKINHLINWLLNSQGNQNFKIPESVLNDLEREIKKQHLSKKQIDETKIQQLLKKTKNNTYYKYKTFLADKLSGREQLKFDDKTIEKIKMIFIEIQYPFEKFQKNRTNFLSYQYTMRKICELLELDDFLPRFPYLKRQNLKKYDVIWKQICEYIGYEFIPSL